MTESLCNDAQKNALKCYLPCFFYLMVVGGLLEVSIWLAASSVQYPA